MKVSAILVSVNLVAGIPLAADAAEEAMSDKASWLKEKLAAIETTKKVSPRKISLSDPGLALKTRTPKLRAFVPGRYLPSQRDLELSSQKARFDDSAPDGSGLGQPLAGRLDQPLSGQVSAYGSQVSPQSVEAYLNGAYSGDPRTSYRKPSNSPLSASRVTYGQVFPSPVSNKRALPSIMPAVPEPTALPVSGISQGALWMKRQVPNMPVVPEPTTMPGTVSSAGQGSGFGSRAQGERVVRQAGALLVQAPVLSPDERAMVNELVELNRPGRSNGFVDIQGSQQPMPSLDEPIEGFAPAASSPVGAPPFPLNLLPKEALEEFLGKRGGGLGVPRATFGSWHQQSRLSGLPYAGFQSHIVRGKSNSSPYKDYTPYINTARASQTGRRRQAVMPQSEVAIYPAYESNSRAAMF